jgi:thiol-disulfide isomerase/thioredoxin
MSGLLFLTAEDFTTIEDSKQNKIMINNINNFSFILFYSPGCPHCEKIIPIMKRLPGTVNGCQFGMINVGKNKQTIRMSKGTITPLTYVPYMILYYNKRPYMRYDGESNIKSIQLFVKHVADKIIQLKDENPQNSENEDDHYSIPEYCIARPNKGGIKEPICYLNFSDAYYN